MNTFKFPHTIKPSDKEINEELKTYFLGFTDGLLEVGPNRFINKLKYGPVAETIYNFEVRPDDIWIVSYPRSGCTLTQEILWLTLNDDYEKAGSVPLSQRFHYLEFSTLLSDDIIEAAKKEINNNQEELIKLSKLVQPKWEILQHINGRRFIKSHLPFSLLPPTLFTSGAKVIYVARNPKNVAVSRYIQNKSLKLQNFVGDFKTYWDFFENNLLPYSPYWAHLEEGWKKRNDNNFLFLFFEDIIKDYNKAITLVSNFLENPLSDSQMKKLEEFLQIDMFRKTHNGTNIMGNLFSINGPFQTVRKGKSGDWDEYFDTDLHKRANDWIMENYKNTTLRFPIHLN